MCYFFKISTSRRFTTQIMTLGIPAYLAEYSRRHKTTVLKILSMSWVTGCKHTNIHFPEIIIKQVSQRIAQSQNYITRKRKKQKMSNKGNLQSKNENLQEQRNQISSEQLQQLKMMFDYFDTDNSGALDTEELKKLIEMIMGSQASEEERLDLLAEVDQDGNGCIQYQQFESLFKKKLMKTNFRKEMQCAFKLIDIEQTSYISQQELERICNQLNMNFSSEDIRLMIERGADADPGPTKRKQKGKVFFQQFLQMMGQN